MSFLPINPVEVPFDFICITGDAYVDHPSFGNAIISRLIESLGFSVGIISQPRFDTPADIIRMGKPRFAYMITSGNIDSMVSHYTAARRRRSDDPYSPGNVAGKRPDRAAIIYSKLARAAFPDVPVILGGLEASLRRFAHYDYWADTVMPSILEDSGADLLVYGMGEHQTTEICSRLSQGENIGNLTDIRGTCYLCEPKDTPLGSTVNCPSLKAVSTDKREYAKATKIQYDWQDEVYGKTILQRQSAKMLVQNPPALSLTTAELDRIYELPFMRDYHPVYESVGGVDAIKEVKFSITHNRGCFGNCNFCSIALHQGRKITTRSKESIVKEAEILTKLPDFKGYIHDVGGPTANFRKPSCEFQLEHGLCKGKKCLAPKVCGSLVADHSEYLDILRTLRKIPGVKKVFIRSGIRYDYLIADKNDEFFRELVEHHISGQLKVAPEHCSDAVLDKMGKPHIESYLAFQKKFYKLTGKAGKEQYLVPYLMSSHPGSTLSDALELTLFLKANRLRPEQVQDFYPTPGTISTAMFYTGLDPYTMEAVYTAKTPEEKALQRALLQYYNPKNKELVKSALKILHRTDLYGEFDIKEEKLWQDRENRPRKKRKK
jgi:uncharacterized radical SAM protein YgiQ